MRRPEDLKGWTRMIYGEAYNRIRPYENKPFVLQSRKPNPRVLDLQIASPGEMMNSSRVTESFLSLTRQNVRHCSVFEFSAARKGVPPRVNWHLRHVHARARERNQPANQTPFCFLSSLLSSRICRSLLKSRVTCHARWASARMLHKAEINRWKVERLVRTL